MLVVSGGLVAATVAYHEHRPAKIATPATTAGEQGSPTPTPAPTDTDGGSAAGLWAVVPSPVAAVLTPLRTLPSAAPLPKPAGLTKMLAPLLADPAFAGDTISLVVADPLSGAVLVNNRGADAVAPASTAKLAVAVAALEVLGPDHRFATSVALAHDGRVVLVGGGDPTLGGPKAVGPADPGFPAPARLSDLAKQAASALKARGITAVNVGYDESLFDGPRTAPGWKPLYITEGDVAPVSALEVDEGRPDLTKPSRAPDPAAVAAAQFAALLSANGVREIGTPSPATAGAGFATLASVQSPRLSALVQRMLGRSDNDLAEALARHVAIATGKPATFTGGADAVRAAVAKLGVAPAGLAMVDGSGLSRSDRVRPQALVQLVDVVLSAGHPRLAPVLQALPVGGFSGTLAARYTAPPAAGAAGLVRAKTGTLDGVVALAGYLDDASGRVLSFAVVVNGVAHNATVRTEAALDRLTAGLTRCGCT
jgi:serine-type D-Ala-D-Ala carboxypeptidase/endopeptidase (penicillin-binding protein 4)